MEENNELKHYGVPGMKWGVRRALKQQAKIQGRKDRATQKYEELRKKDPNSKKTLKAKERSEIINQSKYGKTKGELIAEVARKNTMSIGLQTVAATALIASGAAATAPALAAVASVAIGAGGAIHRTANLISGIHKVKNNSAKEGKISVQTYKKTKFDINKDYKNLSKEDKKNVDYLKSLSKPGQKIDRVIDSEGKVRYLLKYD